MTWTVKEVVPACVGVPLIWPVEALRLSPVGIDPELIDHEYDLVISQEDLGVGVFNLNTGQMLVKNSDWSRWFLDEVYAQKQFLRDRLWENRAVIHLWERQDLSDHVKVVAQKTMNSYMSNYGKGDFVLHFPDMPNEKRSKLMRVWAQFAG